MILVTQRKYSFKGGTHPPHYKELTSHRKIEKVPLPDEVIIPLQQHTGAPCQPVVNKGDYVKAGQKIGDSEAFISAPIHASVCGEVVGIEPRLHPIGQPVMSIIVKVDKENTEIQKLKPLPEDPEPQEIRARVKEAGLVGLGGAAFPTHVKLSPPPEKKIDTVIVNGCECEPYLTCDHRQMLEESDQVLDGAKLLKKAVGASQVFIAIETNKPDAIELLEQKVVGSNSITVARMDTKYPQGAEKQLIKAILNREIPSGGLPMDVGALVQNVGTTIAISKAVREGLPLFERVITISGRAIANPKNLRVRIGTPISFLIDQVGGFATPPGKVIVGGPMTGVAQFTLDVPVVKGTSGIIALPLDELRLYDDQPCVRCGKCVQHCPMQLLPALISALIELERIDEAQEMGVFDCIECGVCAFVCPAQRPIVQLVRYAKAKIKAKGKK
jgi:electron transport complex protein RnfC